MYYLILDTTAPEIKIALFNNQNLVHKKIIISSLKNSEVIIIVLREFMQSTGISYETLDFIGACSGPGSFTAIRVGIAVANALALSLNIPVVGVSAFEVIKAEFATLDKRTKVFIALESKKSDIYGAILSENLEYLISPRVFNNKDLRNTDLFDNPIVILGNAQNFVLNTINNPTNIINREIYSNITYISEITYPKLNFLGELCYKKYISIKNSNQTINFIEAYYINEAKSLYVTKGDKIAEKISY